MRIFMAGPSRPPYAVPVLPGTRALPPPARGRVYARKARRGYDKGRRRAAHLFRTADRKSRAIAWKVDRIGEKVYDLFIDIWFWSTKHWRFLAIVSAGVLPILLVPNEWGLVLGVLTAAYTYATIKYPRLPLLTVVYGWEGFRQFCRVVGEIFCFFLPDAEYFEERGEF